MAERTSSAPDQLVVRSRWSEHEARGKGRARRGRYKNPRPGSGDREGRSEAPTDWPLAILPLRLGAPRPRRIAKENDACDKPFWRGLSCFLALMLMVMGGEEGRWMPIGAETVELRQRGHMRGIDLPVGRIPEEAHEA